MRPKLRVENITTLLPKSLIGKYNDILTWPLETTPRFYGGEKDETGTWVGDMQGKSTSW
jgi:hypothetical protein